MKHLFRVSIERTESCNILVEGESQQEVEEAVEADDLDSYGFDNTDLCVFAREVNREQLRPKEIVLLGVLDGEVCEIDSSEYQDRLDTEKEDSPPVPDTVTLPLFKEPTKA